MNSKTKGIRLPLGCQTTSAKDPAIKSPESAKAAPANRVLNWAVICHAIVLPQWRRVEVARLHPD
jgi:hypothetical protein